MQLGRLLLLVIVAAVGESGGQLESAGRQTGYAKVVVLAGALEGSVGDAVSAIFDLQLDFLLEGGVGSDFGDHGVGPAGGDVDGGFVLVDGDGGFLRHVWDVGFGECNSSGSRVCVVCQVLSLKGEARSSTLESTMRNIVAAVTANVPW